MNYEDYGRRTEMWNFLLGWGMGVLSLFVVGMWLGVREESAQSYTNSGGPGCECSELPPCLR